MKKVILVGLGGIFLLLIGSIFLIAQWLSQPKPNSPDKSARDGLILTNTKITDLDLLFSPLQPDKYFVVIKGVMSDSCSQLTEPEVNFEAGQFQIFIRAFKPSDAVCDQTQTGFETSTELDLSTYQPGNYSVKVAEFEKNFEYNKPSFDN